MLSTRRELHTGAARSTERRGARGREETRAMKSKKKRESQVVKSHCQTFSPLPSSFPSPFLPSPAPPSKDGRRPCVWRPRQEHQGYERAGMRVFKGGRAEGEREKKRIRRTGIEVPSQPVFFFSSQSGKKTNKHTELLWTGSRGEGVFQFDQRASLETRTADGVVSFWWFFVWFGRGERKSFGRRQEKRRRRRRLERDERQKKKEKRSRC